MPVWMASFRVRLLLVTCLVAGVPLGLMGLWITGSASRASEQLLRARVAEVLIQVAFSMSGRWVQERSEVLDIAESRLVRQAARDGKSRRSEGLFTRTLTLRDTAGRTIGASATANSEHLFEPSIPLIVPVHSSTLGPRIGSLEAPIPIGRLLEARAMSPGGVAIIVGVFDRETNAPLVPLPFEWTSDAADTLEWGGERWLIKTREVADPGVRLVGAAPLTPFEQPLRSAAQHGLWVLLAVSTLGLLLASMLTRRMTRVLDGLTEAAEAVSGGNLERRIAAEGGGTEFDRLAQSFNRMTASLRFTVRELAEERALARIGGFAASLAHEVRNPLTAIRVDLQVVEEALPEQSASLRPLRRALSEVDRLNQVVGSVLVAAPIARKGLSPIDLRIPLEAATDAARKTASRPLVIAIEMGSGEPLLVAGDCSALEQIFLNLLLNAVHAVRDRGEVLVVAERDGAEACVRVCDTGTGLTPETARQAFEPFFTTRERGTGLGLTIAARLARAHGGSLELEPARGGGATATVRLPLHRHST